MSIIDWAMAFQKQWRNAYVTSTATIHHVDGSLPVAASKIEPRHVMIDNQVKIAVNTTIFQFNATDVAGVKWKPGVRITWGNSTYEVVLDRSSSVYFDDPTHQTLNVPAKLCS